MNQKLLDVLKHIEKHPMQDLNITFNQPQFDGVYTDFVEYRCQKSMFCPICEKSRELTKHHIIPRGKGGNGLLDNYFYICRECHDEIHGMNEKRNRVIKFLEENSDIDIDIVVETFSIAREKVVKLKYPGYYARCKIKYEMRISKKISIALEKLF